MNTELIETAERAIDDLLGQVRRIQRAARYYRKNPDKQCEYDLQFELRVMRNWHIPETGAPNQPKTEKPTNAG